MHYTQNGRTEMAARRFRQTAVDREEDHDADDSPGRKEQRESLSEKHGTPPRVRFGPR